MAYDVVLADRIRDVVEGEHEAHTRHDHVERMGMRGRAMDGWLRVGEEAVRDDADLRRWVGIGLDYARALPAK